MTSQKIQYIAVFVVLAVIIIWTLYKLIFKKRTGTSSCAGCVLADKCREKTTRVSDNDKPCAKK